MAIDWQAYWDGKVKLIQLAESATREELRAETNKSIDYLLSLLSDLDDADIVFEPIDPEANDPYAAPGEENIGWTIGHLVAHVTASSEEGAAFSSMLARGITLPREVRLRYETPWREVKTVDQCIQRLEESRRMRLAYLDTWPDKPFLHVYREVSERFIEKFGPMNAPATFLFSLAHELGHYQQFRDVIRQAMAAKQRAV